MKKIAKHSIRIAAVVVLIALCAEPKAVTGTWMLSEAGLLAALFTLAKVSDKIKNL